tara:strand:- start:114 stop:1127 length:1014 start_codon:yes stop_codon:yes gene_type:complete
MVKKLHLSFALSNIILVLLLFGYSIKTDGQTIGQFTMWNQNHYLVNPAAAGNQDYFDAALGYRKQWAGVKNSPQSIYAVGHSVLNRPKTHQRSALRISNTNRGVYNKQKKLNKPMLKHAVGGYLGNQEQGAFTRTEAMLTYALHLPIKNDISLSFGLSGGLNSFGFNEAKANVLNEGDPIYNAFVAGENSNQLNVNAGTYLYSDRFFVGFSTSQILQNELKIADTDINRASPAKLEMQHFIIGGFNFDLTNDFRLTPNMLVKLSETSSSYLDMGVSLTYQQFMFMGLNYRTDQVLSASFGMNLSYFLRMGYAYDYTTSELSGASSGSHELFIGITLY